MRPLGCVLIALTLAVGAGVARAGEAADAFRRAVRPEGGALVIAHRGASGYLPEHTLAAYAAAHFMGADVIEPDVVLTADGVPICSHDLTLETTTDVADRFPGRAREDGSFYAIDFTLGEIRTLEKLGREGRVRQPGHRVATLEEMIALVQDLNARTGRTVGIIPEPKHPGFHRDEGRPIERPLLETLARQGYAGPGDGCVIQCFDLDALERMHDEHGTELPLAFLIGEETDRATLERAARVCSALGPKRSLVFGEERPLPLLEMARELGLALYPWTFGDEELDMAGLYAAGVAGLFTDYPDAGRRARDGAAQITEKMDGFMREFRDAAGGGGP
jgi:glycerophosphoryl diester phosphodiesterase